MIREATHADIPALAELATRTFVEAFGDTMPAEMVATEVREHRSERYFRQALRHDSILVDDEAGRLRGYVQVGDPDWPDVDTSPSDQALHRLYVDAPFQGHGLGRRLTVAALTHPRLSGAGRVLLQVRAQNHTAIKLYESFGFKIVVTTSQLAGDDAEYIMARPAPARTKAAHAN
jgi:ribosomal protein S18 acetylase RimI-like enzyme